MSRLEAEAVVAATRIERYISQYVKLKRDGKDLVGLCPFHTEKTPSFKVHPTERYFKCFGCGAGGDVIEFAKLKLGLPFQEALEDVAGFSGMSGASKPQRRLVAPPEAQPEPSQELEPIRPQHVATYTYTNAAGEYLYEVWRLEPGKNGRRKDFLQGYRDAAGEMIWKGYPKPVLYRLPSVASADEVFLVEGEKDAETVERLGYVGTTPPAGSNAAFTSAMADALAGKTVFLMPDNDEAGEKRGKQIANALRGKATVVLFPSKVGKDITDWVEAAGQAEVIEAIEKARGAAARDRLVGPLTPAEIIERYEGGYTAFVDPRKRVKGIPTGFLTLDQMNRGMGPGQLIVIAGRPGMGKTALAMNIAINVVKNKIPVIYFSLEMSSDELLTRVVCSDSNVSAHDFEQEYVTQEEIRRFAGALNLISQFPIRIDDQSGASLKYIRGQVEKFRPGLVIIDYVGLMAAHKAENRVQQIGAITAGLKALAKDLKIPVILVAQVNRSTETRVSGSGKVPQLGDLRESGSIELDADKVWFVYREEYYNRDDQSVRGKAEVIVAKNRSGPTGKVKLKWLGRITKFEDLFEEQKLIGEDI
jgi:replicative DNA helicase